jgi:hypothetical protein
MRGRECSSRVGACLSVLSLPTSARGVNTIESEPGVESRDIRLRVVSVERMDRGIAAAVGVIAGARICWRQNGAPDRDGP